MERSVAHYQNDRYEVLAEVNHDDTFNEFIGTQIKKRSFSINSYLAFMFVLTWVLISILILRFSEHSSIEKFLCQLGLGILFGLFLIPIHELLHGIYLKALGCRLIVFEWDLLKFQFSCSSNQFVMSRKEYHLFLLVPFIIITAILLLLACIYGHFTALFLSMLLMHSSMCAGDFSLLNFSVKLNRNHLFIFYDPKVKKTLFLTAK
ncbi:MAG: hypothetical protein ACJA1A_000918 [Saprospiraceae bacterium]|jgi:hypothetical protein|tara:strand:- start:477 stop:1094 length:618 start_codon:yes stop_codon:yes gene_type:complete